MFSTAFPTLGPVFGLVASLAFSSAYATSNIFLGNLSAKWNKNLMLCLGLIGFSLTSIMTGMTNSLLIVTLMRFIFGICSSAINAPIYQLIATNFPVEFRSTANAIENLGYSTGVMFASFSVLLIQKYGWRANYIIQGVQGVILGILALMILQSP